MPHNILNDTRGDTGLRYLHFIKPYIGVAHDRTSAGQDFLLLLSTLPLEKILFLWKNYWAGILLAQYGWNYLLMKYCFRYLRGDFIMIFQC